MADIQWLDMVLIAAAPLAAILAAWAGLKGQETLRRPVEATDALPPSALRALLAICRRDDDPILARLRPEQVGTVIRGLGFVLGTSLINASITVAILWGDVANRVLLAWFAAVALFIVFGLRGWIRTRGLPVPKAVSAHTLRRIVWQAGLHGAIWGAGFIAFYGPSDGMGRALMLALSLGVAAGGIAALAPIPAAGLAFAGAILLPTTAGLAAAGHLGIAALFISFAGVMGMTVGRTFDTFASNLLARLAQKESAETVSLLLDTYGEQASDWLWTADRDGRLAAVPERMTAMLGRPAGSLEGIALQSLKPATGAEGWPGLLADLGRGEAFRDRLVAIDGPQGRLWLSLSGRISPEDGRWRGVASDVTERERTARQLQAAAEAAESANKAKSAFLASMSHELRTPLNAIIGFSELMMKLSLPEAKQKEYIADIHGAGVHLLGIVNDILDIARLEAGGGEIRFQPVDLVTVVRQTCQMVQPLADRGGLRLGIHLPEGPAVVEGDDRSIRQILLNLLGNAIKFTPPQGRVDIRLLPGPEVIEIEVRDTGIGIEAKDIERVMQPFVQSEDTLARRFEGTGLGLPIAVRLSRLHGGDLGLQSEPGQGTTVRVSLPRQGRAGATGDDRRAA